MISFPSGRCATDVVNIQTNYLGHSHTFHGWICLNHSSSYKHNKLEKCHEKPTHQKAVFSKFGKFSYLSVFRER